MYEQKLGSDKTTATTVDTDDNTVGKSVTDKTSKLPSADTSKKRNYRKRKLADTNCDLSEGEIEDSDDEINRMNLENIRLSKKNKPKEENIDADSDFSVDDPSDEEPEAKEESSKENNMKAVTIGSPKRSVTPDIKPVIDKDYKNIQKEIAEEIPKIDIWKKRTVGEVFDQALKRYYERKANRG